MDEDRITDDIEDDLRAISAQEQIERYKKEHPELMDSGCSWGLVTLVGLATVAFQVLTGCLQV